MGLAELRAAHPWPADRPDVPALDHGWFQAGSARLLAARITGSTRLVVELGSWLGQSTRWLLDRTPPDATVVAIDHWEGSSEHRAAPAFAAMLPTLCATFLANLWDRRDRIVPVRAGTVAGMEAVAAAGLAPDLVFVDAGHETADVLDDLRTAARLFPAARVVGDDWRWDSVRRGVETFAAERGLRVEVDENAWALEPTHG